jgi:hypothetical protein
MLKSYLRYLLKRKNEYHIHSPFVFALYTKVIRGGQPEALKELGVESTVMVEAGQMPERDETVMYVVEAIHESKNKEAFWNTICAHPDVTLTIDLYKKGLFFYREGMEKQAFVLKS